MAPNSPPHCHSATRIYTSTVYRQVSRSRLHIPPPPPPPSITRNRQLSRAIDNCRREKPIMGAPGWESWSDSDSDREEDEEIPSAEHQAAMASIGEYTYFAQGTASSSSTLSTQPPPTIPSQPSAETAAQSSLTENQISMLAQMDKPMADRMRVVFQENNTHGTTYVLQQYHNPQQGPSPEQPYPGHC